MRYKDHFIQFIEGILNSYSQVFFARNKTFAVFLMIVTFFDPIMGMSGLLSVIFSNSFARILGYNHEAIRSGDYGFNSLLVGLGLGFYYAPNPEFFILLAVGALLSFLFTVMVSGILYKYNLPFLSIPFLLALWALMLASRNYTSLEISEHGVYTLNELYATGSGFLVRVYQFLKQHPLPEIIRIYFNSLGAILFQYNILSGILVAIGLLIYSRIAFLLSFISFATAFYFYQLLGADINSLSYYYIGFNFILSGIALGGYFIIPSRSSILWTIILVPVLIIIASSLESIFIYLQLSIYSLPFNIVVITFLYTLKFRQQRNTPKEVVVQHHSPEQNLYHNLSGKDRFRDFRPVSISLPVFGDWHINQAHEGAHTHRGAWKDAWDFVLMGQEGKQYKSEGKMLEDYYCFGKPVIAPADGEIAQIADDVEDNIVGDSNLSQNWGNSIVIKHDHLLYSQISHIKKGSFKVKIGDLVKKGDVIAQCGNSGRSPEPHVHFQIQSTPYIGSKTLNYPLSHYVVERNGKVNYDFFGYPKEGDLIRNAEVNQSLYWAFHLLPGQILRFSLDDGHKNWQESWEVKTDHYNNSYLECNHTKSLAYFVNDGTLFYFTQFKGNKKSLLYAFFLAAFRVVLSAQKELIVKDEIPLHLYTHAPIRLLHDFVAPVVPFMKAQFRLEYEKDDSEIGEELIQLKSRAALSIPKLYMKEFEFKIEIKNYIIERIITMHNGKTIIASCIK